MTSTISNKNEKFCFLYSRPHTNQKVREVRGEEEDGCDGGRDGGQGAGGYNEVEIPNEVMGGRGARNRHRAGGEKANDAVDGDNINPSALLRRNHHRCATTFSAHCCAAIAVPPQWRQDTTTMVATTATTIDDDSDDKGDTDGDGDDGDGNNGNNDYFSHNILHYYNMLCMVIL
jgi:hypothetical protein